MRALKQVIGALIMMGAVTAIAQPADPTAPAPAPAPTAAPAPVDPVPPPPPAVPLTAGEMTGRKEVLLAQIQGDYKYTLNLQDSVRKKKDVIKLTCVNDRLVQMKAQMNVADTAAASVEAQSPARCRGGHEPLHPSSSERAWRSRDREQANQCVGSPTVAARGRRRCDQARLDR